MEWQWCDSEEQAIAWVQGRLPRLWVICGPLVVFAEPARRATKSMNNTTHQARLIAGPGKGTEAVERLSRLGIPVRVFPAVWQPSVEALAPLLRFNGEHMPRRPADAGVLLSLLSVLVSSRADDATAAIVFEEDVDGDMPWPEVLSYCAEADSRGVGVLYLGGILWAESPEAYGTEVAPGLWLADEKQVISCTHAVVVFKRAFDDVIASLASQLMTVDDLLSLACLAAARDGKWATAFVRPWGFWQVDREETRP